MCGEAGQVTVTFLSSKNTPTFWNKFSGLVERGWLSDGDWQWLSLFPPRIIYSGTGLQ
jgi:hypothetical protein